MALTTNRRRRDTPRDDPRLAHRREMLEGVLLLAALVLLAIVARLPTG